MENKPVRQTEPQRETTLKQLGKSLVSMFKRLFVQEKPAMSVLEEEALQTPGKTILKNFLRNRLGVIGLICFILILCFSFVGSHLRPIHLTYQETLLRNIRPGTNYLDYPSRLVREGVKDISSGVSFSVAVSKEGNIYVWGTESHPIIEGLAGSVLQIPKEVRQAEIVQVAAGDRHILALDANNNLYGWGRNNFGQASIPDMVARRLSQKQVADLIGGEGYSAVLFADGELIVWGSVLQNRLDVVPLHLQGRIVKAAPSLHNLTLLLDDGTVAVYGIDGTPLTRVPDKLQDGSVNIVDVTSSYRTGLALDDQGNVYTWGSVEHGLLYLPEFEGNVVALGGGKNNLALLLDTGEVVYWGANHYNQLDMPRSMRNKQIVEIHIEFFQNYAIDDQGNIYAWGLKGFPIGSDQFGRDNLTRLIHGGRISLTVGAIAVVISVIIALVVGLSAGFFGGIVDNVLMRITDFVMSIPFLPLAITLSTIIAGRGISEMHRIYMIMVIIGCLSWPGLARLVRAQILVEREKDFVLAARALGVKHYNIIIRHILPNVFNLVLVNITIGYAGSLLTEAGLSFLGFGVAAPTPSWGNMLHGSQSAAVIEYYWWRWLIPGLSVVAAALSINLVGDALRDAMDPKANEK